MIDIRLLRESPDRVRAALARRSGTHDTLLNTILELDTRRRQGLQRVEKLKAERNSASEEVARRKRGKVDFLARSILSASFDSDSRPLRLDGWALGAARAAGTNFLSTALPRRSPAGKSSTRALAAL